MDRKRTSEDPNNAKTSPDAFDDTKAEEMADMMAACENQVRSANNGTLYSLFMRTLKSWKPAGRLNPTRLPAPNEATAERETQADHSKR